MAKLKVFRTPIGFHDAYVAAPSQKAALAAWGADANLFARGVAEEVTDPALTAEPLARPGEVIRRLRGSAEEQLAAAQPIAPKPATTRTKRATPPESAPPRPDRDAVEAAEAALTRAEEQHREEERQLADEEEALAERRKAARAAWITRRDDLECARDAAEEAYAEALRRWQAVQ